MNETAPLYQSALADMQAGNFREAMEKLHTLTTMDPLNADYVNDLAAILVYVGELTTAVRLLYRAVELRPESPYYRQNLERALDALNKARIERELEETPPMTREYFLDSLRLLSFQAWRPSLEHHSMKRERHS